MIPNTDREAALDWVETETEKIQKALSELDCVDASELSEEEETRLVCAKEVLEVGIKMLKGIYS